MPYRWDRILGWVLGLAALGLWAAGMAAASQPPALACERAALAVAGETGIPADILGALTLTETGRRQDGVVRPWAWSVNSEGSGTWFDDPGGALAFAEDRVAQGRRNLDIGCFQLNYRWHGQQFPSVAAMFDPMQNARYAARFLGQLYSETGDWRAAAAAFHSRSPAEGAKYLTRFDSLRAMLRQRGWGGMAGAPETYNQFSAGSGFSGGGSIAADRRARPLLLAAAELAGAPAPEAEGLALAPGQEAPVPDMRGSGQPVDVSLLDGAGYGAADPSGGGDDPLARLAQDLAGGGQMAGDAATGEGQQAQPADRAGRRRLRAPGPRVTLLGAPLEAAEASDGPAAGAGRGSLAILGTAARGPMLQAGRSLLGPPEVVAAAEAGAMAGPVDAGPMP